MTEARLTPGSTATPAWDSADPAAGGRAVLFPWWLSGILGIVSVLFGVLMLVWPGETVRVMAVFVGIWLLAAGLARIVGAFVSGRGVGSQVLSGIVGVLFVIGGVACLRDLVAGVAMLATLVAFIWLFGGLTEIVFAFLTTGPTRTWLLVLGVLSTLVGLAFSVWPRLSLASLVLAASVSALVIGAGEIAYAYQARKLSAAG
jgi:uncharacterized membrane protein HdeD (DUF308 family)